MATSAVYYKFRSQREPQRLTFDGTGISVWDLKREIILSNKMGKGVDFDLAVYDADTDEEYRDDNYSIPRSSHVIVRRLPPSKPGRGTAQIYVAELQTPAAGAAEVRGAGGPAAASPSGPYRGPMTMRFDAKEHTMRDTPAALAAMGSGGDEAARIAAMFQATTEQWDETQERMAKWAFVADRPPPPAGYICYRCGQKGHWIQECPTNDNQEYDNRPRFKRTTGIPKSMLRTVEKPTAEQMGGVMVTPDGSYVVATPDSVSWDRSRARARPLSKTDVYQSAPSDPALACPLCAKLMKDSVKTLCCSTSFCEECVQTYLFEHDFVCPECEKRIPDLEMLKIDDGTRKQVREYVEKAIERSEEAFEQGTGADEDANAETEAAAGGLTGAEDRASDRESARETQEKGAPAHAPDGRPDGSRDAPVPGADNGAPSLPARPPHMPPPRDDAAGVPAGFPGMPAGMPPEPSAFDPQLLQQLVVMLQNPALPMPMRMQLQMQLQMQQMLFFQSFPGGPGVPGGPGGPMGAPMPHGARGGGPAMPGSGKRARGDDRGGGGKSRRLHRSMERGSPRTSR
ncbi:Protein mpe1 [Malassezia sp. CBS 17886]|nr:Protein mpe1 [Malassezia sp. CBS 17886]